MTNCFSFSFACDCRRWFTPDGGACCRAARARIRRGARPNAAAATHATRCTCPCRRGSWSPRSTTRRRGGASAGTSSTCRDRRHMPWTTLVQLETKTTKGGPAQAQWLRVATPGAYDLTSAAAPPVRARGTGTDTGTAACATVPWTGAWPTGQRRPANRRCRVPCPRVCSACVAAPRIYR
jgi:hypothetical protein